jgi:fructose-1,6-bisphosphatase I
VGSFILVKRSLRIPERKKVYSVNEAYTDSFPAGYRNYLSWAHGNGYSSRYIGSLVADIHRILLTGGVFMYPPTKSHPTGKLRLLYEANPIGMIVEQAGGRCLSGLEPTLDIVPNKLHQRVPLIVGSVSEVDAVRAHFKTPADALP